MISWVFGNRNDGYGGEVDGVGNATMRRMNLTICSIYNICPDAEVVAVEFCPPKDKPSIKDFIVDKRVRVIEVKPELYDLLYENCPQPKVKFYEYLAKDIAIKRSKGDLIIATNPDNIFPSINFAEAIKDIEKGYLVKAIRLEIDRNYLKLDTPTLIKMAENDGFKLMGRFSTGSGDFTGFKKDLYWEIGGYALRHGNWHMDNEFLDRAKLLGYEISQSYSHYHINHDWSVIDGETRKLKEAQGFSTDWRNYKPINKRILENIGEFIEE